LPNTPTSKEAGLPEYVVSGWFALLVPRGTPTAIVAKLNHEVAAALADREVREKFELQGAEPVSLPADQTKRFIAEEIKKYHDIVTNAGIPLIE
jgi:tripartite-type tricarboxylate transporter receptor subunit TctC